jgi:uncharacterized protein YciI
MPYVLVFLRAGANVEADELHARAHTAFIDSLIRQNLVLLGGAFAEPVGDVQAAYLLRCSNAEEARAIAAQDPFVVHDVLRPDCIEWALVGINPHAIDPATVVTPDDV